MKYPKLNDEEWDKIKKTIKKQALKNAGPRGSESNIDLFFDWRVAESHRDERVRIQARKRIFKLAYDQNSSNP